MRSLNRLTTLSNLMMASVISMAVLAWEVGYRAGEHGRHQRNDEIKTAHQRQLYELVEGTVANDLGDVEHFEHSDHRQHRNVLHDRDQIVAHCRHDARYRLRHDDVREGVGGRQVEGSGRLALVFSDSLDPGPIDLRGIGAVLDTQRKCTGEWRKRVRVPKPQKKPSTVARIVNRAQQKNRAAVAARYL